MIANLRTFIIESREELKRVNWPTKEETIKFTMFVIVLSVAVAALLGLLDYFFVQILEIVL